MIRSAAYMYCFDNVNIRRMKPIFDLYSTYKGKYWLFLKN